MGWSRDVLSEPLLLFVNEVCCDGVGDCCIVFVTIY